MSSLLQRIADLVGPDKIKRGTKLGALVRGAGVSYSSELRRIEALPRREWERDDLAALADFLTEQLRTPAGTMSLWPIQAAALRDAALVGGLAAPIAVGGGKALVSLLIPTVVEAARPLVIVPAQLRDQTNRKVLPEMREHWRIHEGIRVVGYSEISVESGADLLDTINPDVIVLDEAHAFKNGGSARTRRFKRFRETHPGTRIFLMSGTITRRSLRDYAHLLAWALGPERSPLPIHWNELQDWADALDEEVEDYKRIPPGALLRLCEKGEEVRSGFRRRLVQTPGIVASGGHELPNALRIYRRPVAIPNVVRVALERLRETWETPNGDPIVEAVDLWRHARELALGFWYRWDPLPPQPWLEARRAWKRFVREKIRHSRALDGTALDSELQVWNWSDRAEKKPAEFVAWRALRDTFEPKTVAEWISDFAITDCAIWLTTENPGIAWIEHVAFGERLSDRTGFPYFGAGASASRDILDVKGSIIASISAHSEGKNLQRYARNLITSPPSSGKRWEQLLGRTHRAGQQADEVIADVYVETEEQRASVAQAVGDSRYIEQTTGARQKLGYADFNFEVNP